MGWRSGPRSRGSRPSRSARSRTPTARRRTSSHKDADVTVMLFTKQKVVANFAFRAGELTDKRIDEVVKAVPQTVREEVVLGSALRRCPVSSLNEPDPLCSSGSRSAAGCPSRPANFASAGRAAPSPFAATIGVPHIDAETDHDAIFAIGLLPGAGPRLNSNSCGGSAAAGSRSGSARRAWARTA